jgi:hypothetical protein
MNAAPSRWRRLAVKLAQHASCVMPGAQAPWADAMRRELDYIADDPAALRWALGCLLAGYRAKLTYQPWLSAPTAWRTVAASGVLVLLIGLAFQDNAGGQTEPQRPTVDETCDAPLVPEEKAVDFIDRPAQATDASCAGRIAPHHSLPKTPGTARDR